MGGPWGLVGIDRGHRQCLHEAPDQGPMWLSGLQLSCVGLVLLGSFHRQETSSF